MKTILLLLAMLPAVAFAQSKTDYKETMQQYMKYYNKGKVDKIAKMFSGKEGEAFYTPKLYQEVRCDWGKMLNYQYLGPDETDPAKVIVFKTVYEKSTHAMSFTLNPDVKIETFFMETSGEEINKMMEEAQ